MQPTLLVMVASCPCFPFSFCTKCPLLFSFKHAAVVMFDLRRLLRSPTSLPKLLPEHDNFSHFSNSTEMSRMSFAVLFATGLSRILFANFCAVVFLCKCPAFLSCFKRVCAKIGATDCPT